MMLITPASNVSVPFTVVTTYNFTGAAESVATAITAVTAVIDQTSALSINATSDSIVTTHQYSNSANFTESADHELSVTCYIAKYIVHSVVVNRSMQYAFV